MSTQPRSRHVSRSRSFGKHLSALAVACGVLGAVACGEPDKAVFIRGVVVPSPGQGGAGCLIDGSADALLLSGVVDTGLTSSYFLNLSIANQLIARADRNNMRAESNVVAIDSAEVEITTATRESITKFSTLISSTIGPSTGTQPTYGAASVNVMDKPLLDYVRANLGSNAQLDLVAYVKVFGNTIGGRNVESQVFQFPFSAVCPGCLVSFPPPDSDGIVDCSTASASTAICNLGQDTPVPCGLCYPNPLCIP